MCLANKWNEMNTVLRSYCNPPLLTIKEFGHLFSTSDAPKCQFFVGSFLRKIQICQNGSHIKVGVWQLRYYCHTRVWITVFMVVFDKLVSMLVFYNGKPIYLLWS